MVDLQIRVGVHVFWFWESKERFMGMFYFGALFYSNPKMKMGLVGMSQFTEIGYKTFRSVYIYGFGNS